MGGINPELHSTLIDLHLRSEQVLAAHCDVRAVGNLTLGMLDIELGQAFPTNPSEEAVPSEEAIKYAKSFNAALRDRITAVVKSTQAAIVYEGETDLPVFDFTYRRIAPRPDAKGYAEAVILQREGEQPVTVTTLGREVGGDQEGLGLIVQGNETILAANANRIPKDFEAFAKECARLFGPTHLIKELLTGLFDVVTLYEMVEDIRKQVEQSAYPEDLKQAKLNLLIQLPQHVLREDPAIPINPALVSNFAALLNSLEAAAQS